MFLKIYSCRVTFSLLDSHQLTTSYAIKKKKTLSHKYEGLAIN